MHRLYPTFKREIRSGLQSGGEAQRGVDGAAAGGAAAQRDSPNIPPRCPAGEVYIILCSLSYIHCPKCFSFSGYFVYFNLVLLLVFILFFNAKEFIL